MFTDKKKKEEEPVNLKTTKRLMIQKKQLVKPKTTPTHTAHNYKHKISKKGKADQSKHTLGKRNKDPYIKKSDQTSHLYWKLE